MSADVLEQTLSEYFVFFVDRLLAHLSAFGSILATFLISFWLRLAGTASKGKAAPLLRPEGTTSVCVSWVLPAR